MMCSAAPVCPLPRADLLLPLGKDDYSLATLYQPSSRSAEKWRPDSITTYSQQAAAAITLLFSPLNRTPSTPATYLAARRYVQREPRFDFFSLLPAELSLKILHYLDPQDLCRVCMVCRHWYRLSSDKTLYKIRKKYVSNQRIHFRRFKENYHSTTSNTPRHSTVSRQRSTPVLSPLNTIPPRTTHSLPRPHVPSSPSHPHRQYTPGPTLSTMVDNVGRLNLRESDSDIRRCLFPNTDDANSDSHTSPFSVPHKLDLMPTSSWLVGKKANKSRLRRL